MRCIRVACAAVLVALTVASLPPSARAAPAGCPSDTDTITEGWICELYLRLLGRSPASEEVAHWASVAEAQSLRSVLYGITYSDERLEGYVAGVYQQLLHRPVDDDGRVFWRESIRRGAEEQIFPGTSNFRFVDERDLHRSLIMSPEGAANGYGDPGTLVDALYGLYLERPADSDGRAHWIGGLTSGASTAEAVIAAFAHSQEKGAVDTTHLYSLIRPPDEVGFAFWTSMASLAGWFLTEFRFLLTDEVIARFGNAGICAGGGPCG